MWIHAGIQVIHASKSSPGGKQQETRSMEWSNIALHLVPFWILTNWGSAHIEETVVGWRNQLRMKTSAT